MPAATPEVRVPGGWVQRTVLRALLDAGCMSQSQLNDACDAHKQTVRNSVYGLIKLGFLVCVAPELCERRRSDMTYCYGLTRAGIDAAQRIERDARQAADTLCHGQEQPFFNEGNTP